MTTLEALLYGAMVCERSDEHRELISTALDDGLARIFYWCDVYGNNQLNEKNTRQEGKLRGNAVPVSVY
jgi:hypothetical protein